MGCLERLKRLSRYLVGQHVRLFLRRGAHRTDKLEVRSLGGSRQVNIPNLFHLSYYLYVRITLCTLRGLLFLAISGTISVRRSLLGPCRALWRPCGHLFYP